MKNFLLSLIAIALLCQGCVSVPKVIRESAKDPATVRLVIRSGTATVELERTNPNLNTLPHSLSGGIITVNGSVPEVADSTDFLRAIFEAGIAAGKKGAGP